MMNLSRIGDVKLVYDGVPLADHFFVCSVSMPLLPTFDSYSMYIDGKPGAWFAGRRIGTRDIRVTLGLLSETRDRVESMSDWIGLSNLLAKDKVCKLELGSGYYVNAILMDDSQMNRRGKWSTANIVFRCFDPFIYGTEHVIPIKSGSNIVGVEGKYPVWPVLEITDASVSYANTIRHSESGLQLRVPSMPSMRSTLVADMEKRQCTVNGDYKAVDPSVSDFFSLSPGENHIELAYGSGTLRYTETYL